MTSGEIISMCEYKTANECRDVWSWLVFRALYCSKSHVRVSGISFILGDRRLISFFKKRICQRSTSNSSWSPRRFLAARTLLFIPRRNCVHMRVRKRDKYQSERMELESHLWLKEPGSSRPISPQCLALINGVSCTSSFLSQRTSADPGERYCRN